MTCYAVIDTNVLGESTCHTLPYPKSIFDHQEYNLVKNNPPYTLKALDRSQELLNFQFHFHVPITCQFPIKPLT